MGYVPFTQLQPLLAFANNGSTADPLSRMLEAVKVFEVTHGLPCQEAIEISAMSEEEFVARFGG